MELHNLNSYLTMATNDVAKGYTKKAILKAYNTVDDFVAAAEKYYTGYPNPASDATIEVGNFKYVLDAKGNVTSPIPRRIICLSGFAAENSRTFLPIVENK